MTTKYNTYRFFQNGCRNRNPNVPMLYSPLIIYLLSENSTDSSGHNYLHCKIAKTLQKIASSRAAEPIHCAQNVKTARLCTGFNKSINNIFLIYHILWISKMAAIDLESSTWVKNRNMLRFL